MWWPWAPPTSPHMSLSLVGMPHHGGKWPLQAQGKGHSSMVSGVGSQVAQMAQGFGLTSNFHFVFVWNISLYLKSSRVFKNLTVSTLILALICIISLIGMLFQVG